MAQCPLCQASILIEDKHLGAIFSCPQCRGVYYINWSGEPEITEHTHEPEPVAPSVAPPDLEAASAPYEGTPAEESSPESSWAQEPALVAEPNPEEDAPIESSEPEPLSEEAAPPTELAPFESPPSDATDLNSFSDVESYANAEPASGPLSYTLKIEGLELAETFDALRDALVDSRLGWNPEEIMGAISNGCLILHNINPAKTAVLVNRIKYLPLSVTWTQEIFATTGGAQI